MIEEKMFKVSKSRNVLHLILLRIRVLVTIKQFEVTLTK